MSKETTPVIFENKITLERLICDNINRKRYFDGVEWLSVRRPDTERKFLIRADALRRIE
jgi:hypothetical protein